MRTALHLLSNNSRASWHPIVGQSSIGHVYDVMRKMKRLLAIFSRKRDIKVDTFSSATSNGFDHHSVELQVSTRVMILVVVYCRYFGLPQRVFEIQQHPVSW